MSPEDFARFLESLSPDGEEAGRLYIRLEKQLVSFFGMKGIADSAGAVNETIKRAAEKIAGGADVPDAGRFCRGIARNVAREWWRRERREETVIRRFIDSLADDPTEELERIEHVLKPCFDRLKGEEQKLLVAYCSVPEGMSGAEHRRQLADKLGITVGALRIQISRLRDRLEDCVEGQMGDR
jgi:DNA-directed RNA polymerase specialized sigma24 family protein